MLGPESVVRALVLYRAGAGGSLPHSYTMWLQRFLLYLYFFLQFGQSNLPKER